MWPLNNFVLQETVCPLQTLFWFNHLMVDAGAALQHRQQACGQCGTDNSTGLFTGDQSECLSDPCHCQKHLTNPCKKKKNLLRLSELFKKNMC